MEKRNLYTLIGLIALLLIFIVVIQLRSSQKIAYYQDSLENKTDIMVDLNHELGQKKYTLDEITSDHLDQMFDENPFNFLPLTQKILNTSYVHSKVPEELRFKDVDIDYLIANYNFVNNFEHKFENIYQSTDYKITQKEERAMDHENKTTHYLIEYTKGGNSVALLEPFSIENCYTCSTSVQQAYLNESFHLINDNLPSGIRISASINIGDSNRVLVGVLGLKNTDLRSNMLIKVYDPIRENKYMHIFVKESLISEVHWDNESLRNSQ